MNIQKIKFEVHNVTRTYCQNPDKIIDDIKSDLANDCFIIKYSYRGLGNSISISDYIQKITMFHEQDGSAKTWSDDIENILRSPAYYGVDVFSTCETETFKDFSGSDKAKLTKASRNIENYKKKSINYDGSSLLKAEFNNIIDFISFQNKTLLFQKLNDVLIAIKEVSSQPDSLDHIVEQNTSLLRYTSYLNNYIFSSIGDSYEIKSGNYKEYYWRSMGSHIYTMIELMNTHDYDNFIKVWNPEDFDCCGFDRYSRRGQVNPISEKYKKRLMPVSLYEALKKWDPWNHVKRCFNKDYYRNNVIAKVKYIFDQTENKFKIEVIDQRDYSTALVLHSELRKIKGASYKKNDNIDNFWDLT